MSKANNQKYKATGLDFYGPKFDMPSPSTSCLGNNTINNGLYEKMKRLMFFTCGSSSSFTSSSSW